jgi:hypothetical protein
MSVSDDDTLLFVSAIRAEPQLAGRASRIVLIEPDSAFVLVDTSPDVI